MAIDGQYQFITEDHQLSAHVAAIRERQSLDASFEAEMASISARAVAEMVMGSSNGSPNNSGWVAELNYLPWRNVKLAARYAAWREFNGGTTSYDGFGRNAKDNNSLYLLAWVLF